jgi:mannitol/fructose-specific phosphotransferase system IIA component (Ntr-type)
MLNLAATVRDGLVLLDPVVRDLDDALAKVVALAASKQIIPVDLQDAVLESLQHRQAIASTAIGHGVAIPHAYVDGVTKPVVAFVRLKQPIDVGSVDHLPTRFLFVLLGPTGQVDTHLDTLAAVARAVNDPEVRYQLGKAKSADDVATTLAEFYRREAPVKPTAEPEVPEGLRYSGRLFGGLVNDVKRRYPEYRSDITEGLHPKSLTAILFLFFACLAPAVTFGGLMYVETGGQIGATEMLVATAVCGVVFALTAGQPLIILGGTGPLLVFTGILYQLCRSFELPFLPCYAWVGLWTSLFTVVLALTDASCLIQRFTRFTDEIFAGLISLIFIIEALKSMLGYVNEARREEIAHDVAFLSLLMALGTFSVAMMLTRFRKSRYLVPQGREFLADFGPSLAVLLMLLFGALFSGVRPEPLDVPQTFGTSSGRPWLVPLTEVPRWVWFASIGPAFLATVLIYLDQNITARIINSPDNRLRKGDGYHLDLTIVGLLTGFCSILGLPWLVAATVRSLNHVRALATVEETISPMGDRYDEIVHVRETRLTGLAVHLLIGASLFLLPLLQTVPKAVLYGLFLYMGIVSIAGNQMFERVGLWIMDSNLYPRNHYMRSVPIRTIHKFTVIQAVCLGVLWIVKVSGVGILFPMFIALLVPIRMLLNRFFDPQHLAALDAEQLPKEEDTEWV